MDSHSHDNIVFIIPATYVLSTYYKGSFNPSIELQNWVYKDMCHQIEICKNDRKYED